MKQQPGCTNPAHSGGFGNYCGQACSPPAKKSEVPGASGAEDGQGACTPLLGMNDYLLRFRSSRASRASRPFLMSLKMISVIAIATIASTANSQLLTSSSISVMLPSSALVVQVVILFLLVQFALTLLALCIFHLLIRPYVNASRVAV